MLPGQPSRSLCDFVEKRCRQYRRHSSRVVLAAVRMFLRYPSRPLPCGKPATGLEGSLQPLVYSALFGLLASTGLRISEAVNLRTEDVAPEALERAVGAPHPREAVGEELLDTVYSVVRRACLLPAWLSKAVGPRERATQSRLLAAGPELRRGSARVVRVSGALRRRGGRVGRRKH